MKTLNRAASETMIEVGVKGATDITGFGLLGHLHEMLRSGGVSARLSLTDIPVIDGVRDLVKFSVPGGSRANLRFMEGKVSWGSGISEDEKLILADAQTSGGLLIAVAADRLQVLITGLESRGVGTRAVIGTVMEGEAGKIFVER
jgi:selenide,water dikinase